MNAAATFYPNSNRDRGLLGRFAIELKKDGVLVGGLVQKAMFDDKGGKHGLDAVELDTGRHIPINRPTRSQIIHGECSLDAAALAESSAAIRRAIEMPADLIIIEKFGDQEQKGKGLTAEILGAMAEGIPTLVAVPEDAADIWNEFSGGLAAAVPFEMEALREWWKAIGV